MLLIEPINPRDRPDYFLTRVEHAADVIAKVGRPNVKIQFDFYHVQIVGRRSHPAVREALSLIGHVQIAAVPSRHEPDEGEVNYPAIFAAIDRIGYAGWIGCEYRPRGRTEDGLGWARPYGVVPRAGGVWNAVRAADPPQAGSQKPPCLRAADRLYFVNHD